MDEKLVASIARNLGIISRGLAYLCLSSPLMNDASVGRQAELLRTFGFENAEIAELLGTTPRTVAVRRAEEKKKKKGMKNTAAKPQRKA